MSLSDEINKDIAGLKTIVEMFGENRAPVSKEKATDRAAVCKDCPQNHPGNWWDTAKSKMADTIRRHLAMRKHLLLETKYDEQIHTCKICSCNLPLKIFVNAEIIKKNTDPEIVPQFPPYCWVRIEVEELPN